MWLNGSAQISDGLPLELSPGEYVVGRDMQCHVVVRDLSVSRRHARLVRRSEQLLEIEDLKSSNGTLVNGNTVGRARLYVGDRVTLGAVEFLISASPLATSPSAQEGVSTARVRRDQAFQGALAQKLTATQQKVLKLLLDGLDEMQIAGRLGCRPRTAHNHIQAIYRALDVHSRQQLMSLFMGGTGLLPPLAD